MRPVDIFHIGPPKTATTWIYRCLREHPQIAAPPEDHTHYYEMFYAYGPEWYSQFYQDACADQKLFDPTTSYIWSPKAAARIHRDNPNARIIFCLRNPVDRAFSYFWHQKRRKQTNLGFEAVLSNYDFYSSWLEPGLIADAVERYLHLFPRENIYFMKYDDIKAQPEIEYRKLTDFIGIDSSFIPPSLKKKVNVAAPMQTVPRKAIQKIGRGLYRQNNKFLSSLGETFLEIGPEPNRTDKRSFRFLLSGKREYLAGMDSGLRRNLERICEPEIRRLEDILGVDLSEWIHSDT